jgi:glycosyltransferase involved in cell wall biosynthesis
MGYLQNTLTRYLARLGADVHLITMDLPPYYQFEGYQESYGTFTGSESLVPGSIESYDGYTLHVVGHRRVLGYMRMVGLWKKLASVRPHVVQTLAAIGWIPLDAALAKPFLGYKLFSGNHTCASVFPLARRQAAIWDRERLRSFLTRTLTGRFQSLFTERCYAATTDCAEIAKRFFGVQKRKVAVSPLGVDTELFYPSRDGSHLEERRLVRQRFGFSDGDIVCIYSGRFTQDKNPLLLANAVSRLSARGEPFRGLFVGNGPQRESIQASSGCAVHPFVPVHELAHYFRAADIGVWPRQESMSMLDGASCGLPIVVNDTLLATERIDGNGITYRLDDAEDLERALLTLRSAQVRRSLGACGASRIAREFSWEAVARRRLRDYEDALGSRGAGMRG